MGMHEIETLLTNSAQVVGASQLEPGEASNLLGNLEGLAPRLELDAGVDLGGIAQGRELHVFDLGMTVMRLAQSQQEASVVYDWLAFLLNFWSHMPQTEAYSSAVIEQVYFPSMRELWNANDFSAHKPLHATLTVYPDGKNWFDDEHNALIRRFFTR